MFLIIAGAMALGEQDVEYNLQTRAFISSEKSSISDNIIFEDSPKIENRLDIVFLKNVRDGFSIIVCSKIRENNTLARCYAKKWLGQSSRLDKIALRAVGNASLSRDLASRYRHKGELAILTFRFSALTDPPSDGKCPYTWCMTPIPAPPSLPPVNGQ